MHISYCVTQQAALLHHTYTITLGLVWSSTTTAATAKVSPSAFIAIKFYYLMPARSPACRSTYYGSHPQDRNVELGNQSLRIVSSQRRRMAFAVRSILPRLSVLGGLVVERLAPPQCSCLISAAHVVSLITGCTMRKAMIIVRYTPIYY